MYGGFNQIGRTGLLAYPATINQALAALMPVNEINPNFLLNFLNFKKESWRNVAASSRKDPNITKNDVEKFKISFPSLAEQSAIGSLFRTLDDLLASYKDNLANYQSLKATMLSKMFPKAGQTVPEISLDGFEGEWKIKELGKVIKFYSGLTYKPSDVLSSGTLVLRSSNVREGELIYTDNVFVNPGIVNCENVKLGDIVVVVRNGSRDLIGKHALIKSEMPNTVIGAFMTGIRCDNPEFINALLDTKMFISEIHRNLGSTINQITTGNFKRMKFYFPLKDEQQAIGKYFTNLDNLISSHQEKISQLETLKKKLLQDMFI
ncbi:type I restriction-modification system S protein [Streptococcus gordonii]|uniref:Type I restriction-modification system S protein n=1 Tax=Streptococcus gordonii TaxID=1302 RepID=A0AAW3H4N6_STRGN|nr:type I restriction-modification system S protein [Streptococcus gordonii]